MPPIKRQIFYATMGARSQHRIRFVESRESEIRISFDTSAEGKGFRPSNGTNCLSISLHQPTMNFG